MCGIGGAWGSGAGGLVKKLAPWLLHRGQEGVGYAYYLGGELKIGAPPDEAEGALVHTRYSTTGPYGEQTQPILARYKDLEIAVVFNGTVVNYRRLGVPSPKFDGEALAKRLVYEIWERGVEDGVTEVYRKIVGAASLIALTPWGILAVRDPRGVRPLAYSQEGDLLTLASEDSVLSRGAEVPPGLAILYGKRMAIWKVPPGELKICALEFVYFSSHATTLSGRLVYDVRTRLGSALAELETEEIDVVTYIPETARVAALAYAERINRPLVEAVLKNRYAGRVFIAPPTVRSPGDVFKIVSPLVKNKRVAVVDDSLIRGTNISTVVKMLREAGASAVHIRIASPPVKWPCFFGLDFQTRRELAAYGRDEEEVRESIGATTLRYLPLDIFKKILGPDVCYGCFTGEYPQPVDVAQAEKELTRATTL